MSRRRSDSLSRFGLKALNENSPDTFVLQGARINMPYRLYCAGARALEKRWTRLLMLENSKIFLKKNTNFRNFHFFWAFLEASQIVLAKLYESSPDTFVL